MNIMPAEIRPQLIMIRTIQRRAPTRGITIPDGISSSAYVRKKNPLPKHKKPAYPKYPQVLPKKDR